MTGLPKNGDRVRFLDNDGEAEGVCNGEPQRIVTARAFTLVEQVYVPVFVPDDGRCVYVHASNLLPVAP